MNSKLILSAIFGFTTTAVGYFVFSENNTQNIKSDDNNNNYTIKTRNIISGNNTTAKVTESCKVEFTDKNNDIPNQENKG